jgi:hypothetical protein
MRSASKALPSALEIVGTVEPIDPARIGFEHLPPVLVAEPGGIDIALGIVLIAAGEGIDAAYRAEPLTAVGLGSLAIRHSPQHGAEISVTW